MQKEKKYKKLKLFKALSLFMGCTFLVSHANDIASTFQDIINSYDVDTIDEAEKNGYLVKSPTREQLLEAINNNPNISSENNIQEYFCNYVNTICDRFPEIDKALLLKNIELVNIQYLDQEELQEITGSSYTVGVFYPIKHSIYLLNDYSDSLDNVVYHEMTHMLTEGVFYVENHDILLFSFAHYNYGDILNEEFTAYFTGELFYDISNYPTKNIELLIELLGKEKVFQLFLTETVYDLEKELKRINPELSAQSFIDEHQKQYDYYIDDNIQNDYDQDIELYTFYIDYFMSKEKKENYQDFQDDCQDFKDIFYVLKTDHENSKLLLDYFNEEIDKVYIKK